MKKILVFLLLTFTIQLCYAKGIGTTTFQILQLPQSAYDASLANTTGAGEVSAISNPSIIPFLKTSIVFTHVVYIEDTKYSVGNVNVMLNKNSGLNFGFCYFDYGTMDKFLEYGDGYMKDGTFSSNDKVFNVSYGTKIYESFYSGFSLKYISQKIDDVSYSGYAVGVSGLIFFGNDTFCSFGINNLGSNIEGYDLPTNLFCSFSSEIDETTLAVIQIDDYYNDELCEFKIATEKSFDEKFFIRLGYVVPTKNYGGSNNSFITNLTLGAGFKFKSFFIDYAWLPKGDLGNINMFTLRVTF